MQKVNLKTPGQYYSYEKDVPFGSSLKYYVFLPEDNTKMIEFHNEDHTVEIGHSRHINSLWVKIDNPFTTRGKYYGDSNGKAFCSFGDEYYIYVPNDITKPLEYHSTNGEVEKWNSRAFPSACREVCNPFKVVEIDYDAVLKDAYLNNLYFRSLGGNNVHFYQSGSNKYITFMDGDRNRYIDASSNKELVQELVRYNAKVIRNSEDIKIVNNKFVHVDGCINPKTVKNKTDYTPAPVFPATAVSPKYVTNTSNRDVNGRFRAKSNIAEFDYQSEPGAAPSFRCIKIDVDNDNYINGIDLRKGEYRSFLKSKIVGSINYCNLYV